MPDGDAVRRLRGRRGECEALDRLVASARQRQPNGLVYMGGLGLGVGTGLITAGIAWAALGVDDPGQSLEVGDRHLTGYRPPLFDNPATVGFLDSKSGAFISSIADRSYV